MKIVHLLPWSTNNIIGGTELFVKRLAIEQSELGHFVIITFPNIEESEIWYTEQNIHFFEFSNPNGNNSKNISSGKESPFHIEKWVVWIKEQKPNILHVHAFEPYIYWFIKVAKEFEVKVFITPHVAQFTCSSGHLLLNGKSPCDGFIENTRCSNCVIITKHKRNNKYINYFIYKYFYNTFKILNSIIQGRQIHRYNNVESKLQMLDQVKKNTDKFIVLTHDYKMKLLINNFPDKQIEVVKYKSGIKFEYKVSDNFCIFKILLIGRLSLEKGVDVFLKALRKIDTSTCKIEVHLFGRNHEDFPSLEEQIKNICNPSIRVFRHGVVSVDFILTEMKSSDLLCIPSTVYEMSPLVIQEAFTAGIPIVGSNIGGIAEYIKDEINGLLFEIGNDELLAVALNRIINDKSFYVSLRNNIHKSLGFNQIANDFIKIYKK